MKQAILQEYEKKRLEELHERNSYSSGVICDVALADKLKSGEGDGS